MSLIIIAVLSAYWVYAQEVREIKIINGKPGEVVIDTSGDTEVGQIKVEISDEKPTELSNQAEEDKQEVKKEAAETEKPKEQKNDTPDDQKSESSQPPAQESGRGQRIDRGNYGSWGGRGGFRPGMGQGGPGSQGSFQGGRPSQDGGKSGPFTEKDGMISINLNNIEMKDVIKTIGDWTKKPIIPTTDEVLKQRLTIYASEKMTREKALSLIYAALRTKGYIVEHNDDRIYIKPIAEARVGSVPTLGVNEPLAKMEDQSQIVEKFFKLENYSPTKFAEIIIPLTAEYGHVTAMESTNSIAVIDTVENLIRIERIINQLDVPESDQIIEKVFKIKNADPLEISQVIMLILEESQQDRSRSGSSRRPPSSSGRGGSSPATSVTIEGANIEAKLLPLPKQSWIIARASAEDMAIIEDWIERLDIEESVSQEQSVIPVRFVDAGEIVNIVNRTLRSLPGSELRANLVVEALRQSKQVVVFGSEENRKMVERIIAEVDLPTDDIFIEKTFKLKHADPTRSK